MREMPFDKGSSSSTALHRSPVIEYDQGSAFAAGSPGVEFDSASKVKATGGGIVVKQSKSGTTADGSAGLTVNFDTPVTAGNSVIALTSCDNAPFDTTLSPTLIGGDASAWFASILATNADIVQCSIYRRTALGGETGVFCTADSAVRTSLTILEVSGLLNAAAITTASSADTDSVASSGDLDPGVAANILLVGMAATVANNIGSQTAGLTSPIGQTGGASVWQVSAYVIQAVAVPTSGVWQLGASQSYAGCSAAFQGA